MTYLALLASLDDWFARGRAAAGPGVVPCTRGCSACCHGPFDISPADSALVVQGLATLPEAERREVVARARTQLGRCVEHAPHWGPPWDTEALAEPDLDALCEALADAPCPALADDGACRIHAWRPATCRLTGLGLREPDGGGLANHCPIQERFPAYAALAPTPFDLPSFEDAAEQHDRRAAAAGHHRTTIAGALVAPPRPAS